MPHSDSDSDSSDDHEKAGDEVDETQGNRDNLVNTICRVCVANGYKRGTIYVDNEFNEVSLIAQPPKPRPDSWVLDDSLDDVISPQKQREFQKLNPSNDEEKPDTFATQHDTFEKLKSHCEKRFAMHTKAITILTMGASGSGKSYTLFGGSNYTSRGLVPRLVEYLFDDPQCSLKPSHVLLSAYVVVGESLVDLLTEPTVQHPHTGALAYSSAVGVLAVPIRPICASSSTECTLALSLAIQTATILFATRAEYFISASIVISLRCIPSLTESTVVSITFLEAPSLVTPPSLPPSIDRLAGSSLVYLSARALRAIGTSKKRRVPPGVNNFQGTPQQQHHAEYSRSSLSYILQDALLKCPDVFIIGCLRANQACFEDNFAVLDFMNRIDVLGGGDGKFQDMSGLSLDATISSLNEEIRECIHQLGVVEEREEEARQEARAIELGITREQLSRRLEKEKLAYKAASVGSKRDAGPSFQGGVKRDKNVPPVDRFAPALETTALKYKVLALSRLLDGFRCIASRDSSGIEAMFNRQIPFLPPFDLSVFEAPSPLTDKVEVGKKGPKNESGRRKEKVSLVGKARWINPAATAHYTENASKFLQLHGLCLDFVGPPETRGDERKQAAKDKKVLDSKLADCELLEAGSGFGETLGITFAIPWSQQCDGLDPYILPLSPGGLGEHFGKIVLPVGQCLLRGQSGASSCFTSLEAVDSGLGDARSSDDLAGIKAQLARSDNAVVLIDPSKEAGSAPIVGLYAGSPVEKDVTRDQDTFSAALDFVVGNGVFPNESLRAERTANDGWKFRHVFIPGPGVDVLHAIITIPQAAVVRIRPSFSLAIGGAKVYSRLVVNGQVITEEITLQDQDVIQLGYGRFLQIRIPTAALSAKAAAAVMGDAKRSELSLWEWAILRIFGRQLRMFVEEAEQMRRHIAHLDVRREEAAVTKEADRTPLMKMENFEPPLQLVAAVFAAISPYDRAYLCSLIGAAELVTFWGKLMRRKVLVRFQLHAISEKDTAHKGRVVRVGAHVIAAASAVAASGDLGDPFAEKRQFRTEYERKLTEEAEKEDVDVEEEGLLAVDVAAPMGRRKALLRAQRSEQDGAEASVEDRLYCGQLLCTTADNTGQWWWCAPLMIERFGLVQGMHQVFQSAWCGRDTGFLETVYPPLLDAFQDTLDDELIGVGFLYLDGLQYLLDIDDSFPLTDLAGHPAGACRVRCRIWIDKIETSPAYLSVDTERTLEEFQGKTAILRLYFESLQDLPANLCASTFINFKFFFHSSSYKTPRHGGATTCPFLHSTIRIEQKITPDFIEYVRRGSLEIEVFGKRRVPSRVVVHADQWHVHVGERVEPYIPPVVAGADDAALQSGILEEEALVESMKQELDDLAADLQAAERQLLRASKVGDLAQEENAKLMAQLQEHQQQHAKKMNVISLELERHKAEIAKLKSSSKSSSVCTLS